MYMWSEGMAPFILMPGPRRRRVFTFAPRPIYSPGKQTPVLAA
jgi:hypothetical protein